MRFFAQTLTGDVKKWFKTFPANRIDELANFQSLFIDIWERMKNPLQILYEYDNIRRAPNDSIQDYCTRFNDIYNAIPAKIKLPPNLALIKFPDSFAVNISYQLREINIETLEQMRRNVVSVEANLLAKKEQTKNENKVVFKEEASTLDGKVDVLANSLERIMDRLENVERENQWENQ